MTAALIAEALAHAESVTPGHVGNHARGAILDSEGIERGTLAKLWHADEMTIEPGDGVFVRRDVVDAALAHLAERAERAEAASRFDVAAYRHRLRVLRMRYNTDANRWAWAGILRAIEILDGMVTGAEVDAVESLNAAIEEDGRG